jgi:hypothetical protein
MERVFQSPYLLETLFHDFELLFHSAANRTVILGCIFNHKPANLAHIVVGFPVREHIVHGLFIEVGMTALHVPRPGKNLGNGFLSLICGIFDEFRILFHIGVDFVVKPKSNIHAKSLRF